MSRHVLCCAVLWRVHKTICALQVRNEKPRTKEEQGQQKRQESLIHHSNVMHYSTTQQVCVVQTCLPFCVIFNSSVIDGRATPRRIGSKA